MAIVQTVNLYQFREAFRLCGRNDQFSYEALEVIFDYLDQLSDDIGEPVELDVIGICCDYYEASWQDIASDYRIDLSEYADDDYSGKLDAVLDYLNDQTIVLGETSDGIVFQCF